MIPRNAIEDIIKVATSPSPGVVSVIASAGAGKTFTLTSVYIALLLKGIGAGEILGITFTNKAAEEMKDRVLRRLMAMVFERDKNELSLFTRSLGLSEEELLVRARASLESLLFDYSSFSLQTIDSFLNRLRLAFSFELGISPGAELRPSVYPDAEMIVSRMLEKASVDPSLKEAISRFVNYYSEALALYRSWDPMEHAQKLFPTYLTKQSHYAKEISISSETGFNLARIRRVLAKRDRFLGLCQELGIEPTKNVSALLEGLTPKALTMTKDITSTYLTRRYLSYESFPKLIKGAKRLDPNVLDRLFSAWQEFVLEFYELELDFSRSFTWPFLQIYSAIFEELNRFQTENDIAYLSLLQLYISRLDPMVVAEKSTARYGRYKYFLIDEFQDTSLSQWRALYPLLEEALSVGGMLFCVGDPKQTIYRWRGSEPDMFTRLKESFVADQHWFVLPDNWRSAPEIVQFNNRLFTRFPERAQELEIDMERIDEGLWQRIRVVYSPNQAMQVPRREYEGEVELLDVEVSDASSGEEVRERILEALVDYIEQSSPGEKCVLVRRRSEAREVISALTQRGIPVLSEESLALVSHPVIVALISLLRWMAFPEEKMYLRMFFLSDLWAKFTGRQRTYWERKLRISTDERLITQLERVVSGVRASSIYLMVRELIRRLKIEELFPEQRLFLQGFLDVLWRWESENGASLRGFLDYWSIQESSPLEAERINLPVSKDSVKVMTIHGSKGLEFEQVLLPFLDLRLGESRARGLEGALYWDLRDQVEVYYITRRMAERHPKLAEIYNREFTLRVWDDLNLLYVATTRAKHRLVLFMLRPGARGLTWQGLVEGVVETGEEDDTDS